jgi:hypothetical protein
MTAMPTITITDAVAALVDKNDRTDQARANVREAMRCITNSIVHPDPNALRHARRCLEHALLCLAGE